VGRGGRSSSTTPSGSRRNGTADQGPLDGRPPALCAATVYPGEFSSASRPPSGAALPRCTPKLAATCLAHEARGPGRRLLRRQRGQAQEDPPADVDEERFLSPHGGPVALPRAPREPVRLLVQPGRGDLPGDVRGPRIDDGDVRRQLKLARAGRCPSTLSSSARCWRLQLLRRRLRTECPTGGVATLFEGREGDLRPARRISSEAGGGARLRRRGEVPDDPHFRDLILFLRVLPRRHGAASGRRTRRVDRPQWPRRSRCSGALTPEKIPRFRREGGDPSTEAEGVRRGKAGRAGGRAVLGGSRAGPRGRRCAARIGQ